MGDVLCGLPQSHALVEGQEPQHLSVLAALHAFKS